MRLVLLQFCAKRPHGASCLHVDRQVRRSLQEMELPSCCHSRLTRHPAFVSFSVEVETLESACDNLLRTLSSQTFLRSSGAGDDLVRLHSQLGIKTTYHLPAISKYQTDRIHQHLRICSTEVIPDSRQAKCRLVM